MALRCCGATYYGATYQVHFSVTEDQLHLLAKLLEYSFNYSRFLPNW